MKRWLVNFNGVEVELPDEEHDHLRQLVHDDPSAVPAFIEEVA